MRNRWFYSAMKMIPTYITIKNGSVTEEQVAWAVLNCAIEDKRRPWFVRLGLLYNKYLEEKRQ
jgi:hypothetical protein